MFDEWLNIVLSIRIYAAGITLALLTVCICICVFIHTLSVTIGVSTQYVSDMPTLILFSVTTDTWPTHPMVSLAVSPLSTHKGLPLTLTLLLVTTLPDPAPSPCTWQMSGKGGRGACCHSKACTPNWPGSVVTEYSISLLLGSVHIISLHLKPVLYCSESIIFACKLTHLVWKWLL